MNLDAGIIDEPEPETECDALQWGSPPTMADGHCRCIICSRCGHHTGNSHQGHYWAHCKATRSTSAFHFCCPDPAYGCELETARAHDDSPRRNHIVSIYGRVIECPNDSASPASNSTTATPPEPCAAPNASQQQPPDATSAPTPPPAATAGSTSNYAASSSSSSNPDSHAHDAASPSGRKTMPTSATPTDSRDTAGSSTPHATGQQAGKDNDERHGT